MKPPNQEGVMDIGQWSVNISLLSKFDATEKYHRNFSGAEEKHFTYVEISSPLSMQKKCTLIQGETYFRYCISC